MPLMLARFCGSLRYGLMTSMFPGRVGFLYTYTLPVAVHIEPASLANPQPMYFCCQTCVHPLNDHRPLYVDPSSDDTHQPAHSPLSMSSPCNVSLYPPRLMYCRRLRLPDGTSDTIKTCIAYARRHAATIQPPYGLTDTFPGHPGNALTSNP